MLRQHLTKLQEAIRRQQLSANNQAYSQVAVAPEPDVAPPPPAMAARTKSVVLDGWLSAGADFGTAMSNMKKPTPPGGFDFKDIYNWQ